MKKNVIAMNKMLFYVTLPGVIIFCFSTIFLLVQSIVSNWDIFSDGSFYISLFSMVMLCFVFFVVIKSRQKRIIFTKEQIEVYWKNQLVRKVTLDEVSKLYYYPFRFHYIFTIYAGALSDGGATILHCQTMDGDVFELGYISEKDAIELRNHFYHDKMTIHFERKSKSRLVGNPTEGNLTSMSQVSVPNNGSTIENVSIVNTRNILAQNAMQGRYLYVFMALSELIFLITLNQNVLEISSTTEETILKVVLFWPVLFFLPLLLNIGVQWIVNLRLKKHSAYHYYFFETEFETYMDSSNSRLLVKLQYSDIKKAIETKRYLFLFINQLNALYVEKQRFNAGDIDNLYQRLINSGVRYKRYMK